MNVTKTAAIVLRVVKYGDSGLVADMLTESHGRVSFMVRLSKSGKGKMRRQLFHPLSILEIDFDFRPKSQLQKLRDVRLLQPLHSLMSDPMKLPVAMFVGEFLSYATQGESDNPALFSFVTMSVEWFDGVERPSPNFHLVFMIRLSMFVGFFPNTEDDLEDGYFDLLNACFCSSRPLHSHYLEPFEASKISLLMRLTYPTMHLCAMSRKERNRCTEVILDYYRLHVPGFPQMRSTSVLRELFD